MLVFALWLASAPQTASIDRVVRVPAGEVRGLRLSIRNSPAMLEARFKALQERARVRLVLVTLADEARFISGRQVKEIAATDYLREAQLRIQLAVPGDYTLLVDNRAGPPQQAAVSIQGAIRHEAASRQAVELSPARRRTIVAFSLLFFGGIVWLAGRRLLATLGPGRRNSAPPPGSG
jgi:hypothetical protein